MSHPVAVFVFGSNLAGRHGKGAALFARMFRGAITGQGIGPQGNSYAIPTKDEHLVSLPLSHIGPHVAAFLEYAREHPDKQFEVTAIGCGLAGFTPIQMVPFFRGAPGNVSLPREFVMALALRRKP